MTFSYLQVKNKSNVKKYRQQFLLNVALACKDFLDVALDALWGEMDSLVPLLGLLPALQLKNKAYVLSGNVSPTDWDRLQYYSRKVKFFKLRDDTDYPPVHPSTYFRIAQLQSSALFPSLRHLLCNLSNMSISDSRIFFFLSPLLDSLEFINIKGFENTIVGPFLATLSSQVLTRIVLRSGRMSVDILKNSMAHFQQLRSLELSDAVHMSDFTLWEVLGTLPSLENFTLTAIDPASHPAHLPDDSNSQSGFVNYFNSLERVCITGSFSLIENLLDFIDSPWLKSIKVYPVADRFHEDDPFTPSMTIVASKWSQSLEEFVIGSSYSPRRTAVSKCLMLLTDFPEMETFQLTGWRLENANDDVRRLVMSWPKLRTLSLNRTPISLSTLRIIAENCPDLHNLKTPLDISTIPPFDDSSKRLSHNLETMTVGRIHPSESTLQCQIQVTRHLDLIFPSLKTIEVVDENWSEFCHLVKLCQDVRRA